MAGVPIVFLPDPNGPPDQKIGTMLKAFFLSLPYGPADSDMTVAAIVEDDYLRNIVGIKDKPDLHLIMALERDDEIQYSWSVIQMLPSYAFINMLKTETGNLLVLLDDRVALAKAEFSRNSIPVEVVEHPRVADDRVDKVAAALSVPVGVITRCIILISKAGEAACAVIPSSRKLNKKKLEAACGIKKLEESKDERDIEKFTSFDVDSLPAAAVIQQMPTFIDESLVSQPVIVGSAGFPRISVKFSPKSLIEAGFKPAALT